MKTAKNSIYPSEKRISQRFKIPGATVSYRKKRWLFKKKSLDEEFCPLQDLSRGGLRFACRRRLKSGTRLYLRLSIPGERAPLLLLGQVRWSSTSNNETFPYQTGIQFNIYGKKKGQNYPGNLVKIISLEQKFIDLDLDMSTPPDEYDIESS
jgi:hypothetical protein